MRAKCLAEALRKIDRIVMGLGNGGNGNSGRGFVVTLAAGLIVAMVGSVGAWMVSADAELARHNANQEIFLRQLIDASADRRNLDARLRVIELWRYRMDKTMP